MDDFAEQLRIDPARSSTLACPIRTTREDVKTNVFGWHTTVSGIQHVEGVDETEEEVSFVLRSQYLS